MTDVFTKRKRSEVMSRIRGTGNLGTELRLIQLLRQAKLTGWRRNVGLPGKPDFIFADAGIALFTDGCFWHGCPRCYRAPKQNRTYWEDKLVKNKRRDRRVNRQLRVMGWSVARIRECDIERFPRSVIKKIERKLNRSH